MTARPVLAGVDGSARSRTAAEYAASVALRRGCPLRLLYGYLHPLYGYPSPLDPASRMLLEYPPEVDLRETAQAMLEAVAEPLRTQFPTLPIDCVAVLDGGAAALIQASHTAELVVVGSRGLGGFALLLLGSVSSQVAAHANAPVIVVRPAEPLVRPDAPVLVGVDGSANSALAVDFAFTEAATRDVALIAMTVYWPAVPLHASRGSDQVETQARQQAEALLAEATAAGRAQHPNVTVQTKVCRHLDVARQFIEESHQAALVVVGARGRGGFAGLLLGSVSQALVHHAACPVAVVHPRT